MAASCGSAAACHILIEAAADVGAKTHAEGHTPLHLAALHNHAEAAHCLISADSGLFLDKDKSGKSAFDLASSQDHIETMSVLQRPQDDQEQLVQRWYEALHIASLEHQLTERR